MIIHMNRAIRDMGGAQMRAAGFELLKEHTFL